MKIEYSPKFVRQYRKLPIEIKLLAEKKEKIFRENPFDPRLRTHKLTGDLDTCWAFWLKFKCRITFEFLGGGLIYFHSVGPHDIVYR